MYGMMGGNWGYSWIGGSVMIFFWILVIIGVIVFIRGLTGNRLCGVQTDETPLEMLRRRYARGDMTKDEFEAKKRDLGL